MARLTGNPEFTADNLIDLAKQELIGICFEYRGDIALTFERSPNGESKDVGIIPFNGFVKLMQRPTTNQAINEFGVLVSILRADGIHTRIGQPYRLPVPNNNGGFLKPGYQVVGFIEETEIARDEWWILNDDLTTLIAEKLRTLTVQTEASNPRQNAAKSKLEVSVDEFPALATLNTKDKDSEQNNAPSNHIDETSKPKEKPWLVVDPKDPLIVPPKDQQWYTPARYFARQLVIEDSTLLVKRLTLADKVSSSLKGVGILKRGNKYPLAADTILKAFVKVTLG